MNPTQEVPPTPTDIDAVLPQTQCGLCGYKGCLPYAKAIVAKSAGIDRCVPGGKETLFALAQLTHQDPAPYLTKVVAQYVPPKIATIDENNCIGCTKCLNACPVDAIVGAPQHMHTILPDCCTGCGLCLPPCPVDCIDLSEQPQAISKLERKKQADQARENYKRKAARLAKQVKAFPQKRTTHHFLKAVKSAIDRVQKRRAVVSPTSPEPTSKT